MSITHLLDHTCVVWRPVETLGSARETIKSWLQPFEVLECTLTRKNTVLSQAGPGIQDVGDRRVYFDVGPTFLKRDVIELLTGPDATPDAPVLLEVESVATPRGHHIEVRASEYNGKAPEIGS